MKKTLAAALFTSILLMQLFIILGSLVRAEGCSVAICEVSPPGGVYPKGTILNINVTVTWSIPENTTIVGVAVGVFCWIPESGWYGGWRIADWVWFLDLGERCPELPCTCAPWSITIGATNIERYKFVAQLWCEYLVDDETKNCTATDEKEATYSMAPPEEHPVTASFAMYPEAPTVNDTITFTSTSTCVNGTIVEYKWYSDGKYLGDVGNKPSWDWISPTVGTHTVKLTVVDDGGNTDTAQKTFEVEDVTPKQLSLTASSDKSTYITREKIIIKGKLTFGGKPVDRAEINIKVHRSDGTVDSKFSLTETDGSYTAEYEVPAIPFKTIPPSPEDWTIKIFATPAETEYGHASTTLTVKVLPIWLKLHGIYLVQVVEPPLIKGEKYLAAGKEAGLRVMVSCPSLIEVKDASKPKVKVKFFFDSSAGEEIKPIEKEKEIGAEPTPVDFIFTLPPGRYFVGAMVDPEFKYVSSQYLDDLYAAKLVTSKKMKTLKIEFVPLYLQMKDKSAILGFQGFCKKHLKFMKSAYPLPDSNFKFVNCTETRNPVLLIPTLPLKRWLLLKALSIRSYLTADKVVGVLPDNKEWWGEGESGYSGWSAPPFFYYTRCVLVKYGSDEGVTAHEIGHTVGLNRGPWNEEYKLSPPFGNEVKGLILKNGNIYNITREDERFNAFGPGCGKVYCFMGNNPGFPMPSWVCDKTYPQLFKYLMDPPSNKVVYVAGVIFKNGTVQLDNWYLMEGEPDPLDEGDYTIQCVSSNGTVLYSTDFGWDTEDFLAFGFVIPYPDGTSTILIKKANEILKEVQRTPNPPTVTIQHPNGGEVINGNLEVRWSAEDLDSGELSYSVLYSHDGGETWTALALELNETSYTLDLSMLAGGDTCLVKVVATDGFNTGQDVSDGFFTVSDKNPVAYIASPEDFATYQSGEEVILKGLGFDMEDGELKNSSLQWFSSIDGFLGSGNEIELTNLSPGVHEVTLEASDSKGKTGEATLTLTVEKISAITVVDHLLCEGLNDAGDPLGAVTTFKSDETVFSWLEVANGTQGDEVYWLFQGPNGITEEYTYTLEWDGNVYCWAPLDLNGYNIEDAVGDWSVTVSINGVEAFTDQFTVEPLTGLVWWSPIIGLLMIAVPVSFAIIVVIILINRRKT